MENKVKYVATDVKEDKVEVELPEETVTLELLINTRDYVVL